ncbi:hypothetical protein CFB50_09340 [Burkholderia sp. AU33423]|nr:hypothetical protein CFB50_09340 [Burkholderia sp. AU33423]
MRATGAASGWRGVAHRITVRCGEKHTNRNPDHSCVDGAHDAPQQAFDARRQPHRLYPTALDSTHAVS